MQQFDKLTYKLDSFTRGATSAYNASWAITEMQRQINPQLDLLKFQMFATLLGSFGEKGMSMVKDWIPGFEIPKGFQSGGYVPKTGIYKLHAGEKVQPVNNHSTSVGDIYVTTGPGTSDQQVKEIGEKLAQMIKYKRLQGLN